LLLSGIDIRGNDRTPLQYASEYGHWKCVDILLKAGANVNHASKLGMTALHYAAENGNKECVRLLLLAGASVNAFCQEGMSPLHIAAENGHVDAGFLLIQGGANLNLTTHERMKPIHYAAEYGHDTFVELLLALGAKIQSKRCLSPLYYSIKSRNVKCVTLLLRAIRKQKLFVEMNHEDMPEEIAREIIWFKRECLLNFVYGSKIQGDFTYQMPQSISTVIEILDLLRLITEYI